VVAATEEEGGIIGRRIGVVTQGISRRADRWDPHTFDRLLYITYTTYT
jgi:hypothetical protein